MGHSRVVFRSPEHMLRVLHGHLQRKRKGLRDICTSVELMLATGELSADAATKLVTSIASLLRADEDLTTVECDILERDERHERILRERYPLLSDTLLLVCICTIDGLSTAEVASIINRSEKTVDHYRQEIRTTIDAKGVKKNLQSILSDIVGA